MKRGEIVEGIVERVDFPNKGYIKVEDRWCAVKGVIKGQTISCRLKKVRKDRCQGMLLSVVKASEMEDEIPACPHFGQCGGCFYQTVSYDNQLQIKENQVHELIDSVCDDYEWQPIKQSPSPWEYRNKMEFSFGDEVKDGPLALGLHKKNSFHDIVITNECKLVASDYNKVLQAVLVYFRDSEHSFYRKMQHKGFLRHLVIRRSSNTGELLINLVVTTQEQLDEKAFVEMLLDLQLDGKIAGILLTLNDSLSDVVQSDETKVLYGQDYIYEDILGLKFKISAFSFFQTNSKGAEVLYDKARSFIVGEEDLADKVVYDLYSGTGTIAQILAPIAKKGNWYRNHRRSSSCSS